MTSPGIGRNTKRSMAGMRSLSAIAAFVVAICFGICTGTAYSQDAPPPQQGSEMGGPGMGGHGHHQMPSVDDQVKHLTKKLNLSDDQQTKVRAALEDTHKQMEALHSDSSMSQDDKHNKMRELHETSQTQIKAILNEDQQKKFDQMEQERGHRGDHEGAPPSN